MPVGATRTSSFFLPPPVTANGGNRSKGRNAAERSAAPSLVALISGLVAVSSNQRAKLLFIGAGTVALGLYFVVPPPVNEKTHSIPSMFLRRMPDVFTACGCILIMLGIGIAFPNAIALIPLFVFISCAALAVLFGTIPAAWIAAVLYGASLVSLATFVVFALMA